MGIGLPGEGPLGTLDEAPVVTGADAPVPATLDELVVLAAEMDRLRARVAVGAARLEAAGAWTADGWVSMAAWLASQTRRRHAEAKQLLAEGRFLERFTAVGEAALSGRLCAGQVRALRKAVSEPVADMFAAEQQFLVDTIAPLDVATAEQACAHWRAKAEALADVPEPQVPTREWRMSVGGDGCAVGQFVFDAATAAQVKAAIRTATHWDGERDTRTPAQQAADAVADVFAFFNAHHDRAGSKRHHVHVELILPFDQLDAARPHVTTVDGVPVPTSAADAFLCDCLVSRVVTSPSELLDYGRAVRTVPRRLRRAVAHRDGGCRFPGCDRPVAWCDAHHIRWWRLHGETKLDNLLLLCNLHHHLVHRPGWQLTLHPDATLEVRTPDGHVLTSWPRPRFHDTGPPAAA